jgi:hypothetical protein
MPRFASQPVIVGSVRDGIGRSNFVSWSKEIDSVLGAGTAAKASPTLLRTLHARGLSSAQAAAQLVLPTGATPHAGSPMILGAPSPRSHVGHGGGGGGWHGGRGGRSIIFGGGWGGGSYPVPVYYPYPFPYPWPVSAPAAPAPASHALTGCSGDCNCGCGSPDPSAPSAATGCCGSCGSDQSGISLPVHNAVALSLQNAGRALLAYLNVHGCDCSPMLKATTGTFQAAYNVMLAVTPQGPGRAPLVEDGEYGPETQAALSSVVGQAPAPCYFDGVGPCDRPARPQPGQVRLH